MIDIMLILLILSIIVTIIILVSVTRVAHQTYLMRFTITNNQFIMTQILSVASVALIVLVDVIIFRVTVM